MREFLDGLEYPWLEEEDRARLKWSVGEQEVKEAIGRMQSLAEQDSRDKWVFFRLEAVTSGVPQESVLELQLFTIHINDFDQETKPKPAKFADDTKLLIAGGSFGLREFAQVRYDVQKVKRKIDPVLEAQLNKNKNKTSIDSEYQKLQEQNLDDWVNIRGPRPWEDSRAHQEEQRKNLNASNT
ncbi:cytochrome c oxidase assembly protein COX16 homolog, mitochondrial [Scyliorhinus torazame]|uniref:cytochrome c oxidase assembly protein COX16 homolog, mitochondrial n=1 Tax=Scyliorhinus torazame TaxID=75743 RepID=UPI003B5CAE64